VAAHRWLAAEWLWWQRDRSPIKLQSIRDLLFGTEADVGPKGITIFLTDFSEYLLAFSDGE
jgi:hypothetical protein